MRPSTFLVVASSIWLAASSLSAQRLTWGEGVPLPEMPMGLGVPSVVALDDGTFVLGSRVTPHQRPTEAYFATVNANGDTVLAAWDKPYSMLAESLGLVATANNSFFHTSLFGDYEAFSTDFAVRLQDPIQGTDTSDFMVINPPDTASGQYDVARLSDGRFVAIWGSKTLPEQGGEVLGILAQIFTEDGGLVGPPIQVTQSIDSMLRVAATSSGGFMAAWRLEEDHQRRVLARAFDQQGVGGPIQEIVGEDQAFHTFDLASRANGEALVVWTRLINGPDPLMARRLDAQARPYAATIPLTDAGYVPRTATDRYGRTWIAWRSSPRNFVRVMGPNGALSETVQVPPRVEGRQQSNPQIAVNYEGQAMVTWAEAGDGFPHSYLQANTLTLDSSCMEGDTMLCLHQGRFQVEVEWTDYDGEIGQGHVVPFQSSDSGLFWFFDAANWEVMVKVIDGCDFNGFYWFFSAATTDVAYDLKVTDTVTGLQQIYSNGLGEPAPANTDTMALMSCGHGPP